MNEIPKSDCKALLKAIERATTEYEYLTPAMFSGLLHVGIISYLRGRGYKIEGPKKAEERVNLLEGAVSSLACFSMDNPNFEWFITRLERLQEAEEEREELP